MRTHKLKLDDLTVESFATAPLEHPGRGTVHGHQSGVATCATCATCVNFLCWVSRLQTNCCTRDPANGCTLPGAC